MEERVAAPVVEKRIILTDEPAVVRTAVTHEPVVVQKQTTTVETVPAPPVLEERIVETEEDD